VPLKDKGGSGSSSAYHRRYTLRRAGHPWQDHMGRGGWLGASSLDWCLKTPGATTGAVVILAAIVAAANTQH
jgi:hypothetical protein